MDTDPADAVTKALAAHQRAEKRVDETRAALHAAIAKASAADVKQSELVRLTGYTRERIRQIVIAAKGGSQWMI